MPRHQPVQRRPQPHPLPSRRRSTRGIAPAAGLACTAALLLLAVAGPAQGFSDLYLSPAETRVMLESGSFDVDLSPITHLTIPITPQGGLPGTTAGTLPGGTPSDGLVTTATGTLLANLVLDPSLPTNSSLVFNASLAFLSTSGMWLPGPGGSGGATQAAAGFAFTDASFGIDGRGALRDIAIGVGGQLSMTPDGPDAWSVTGLVDLSVLQGWLDYDAGLPGFQDTSDISGNGAQGQSVGGRYEILPSGIGRLSLPFSANFFLDFAGSGFPIGTEFTLAGEIVAYTQPVPEPGAALLVVGGMTGLIAAQRRRVVGG